MLPTLTHLAPNFHRIDMHDRTLWFSYKTLIAFRIGSDTIISENCWKQTTGKHLNAIGPKDARIPRDQFEQAYAVLRGCRIEQVRLVKKVDECPDFSFLGEYSNSPEDGAIDRKERGDMGRNEFRYFNPGCNGPEYIEQDYARMEAYNRGDWCFLGCWVEAVVSINGMRQTLKSSGLWGIESDSGVYFDEVKEEQLGELKDTLEALGFSDTQVDEAFQEVEMDE